MSRLRRRRPSGSMLVALLALVLALTGSAFATALVTSRQIKNGTIQLVDISKKTREALRGRPGPPGPPGEQGPPGGQGASEVAIAYAAVKDDGTIDSSLPSKNLANANVTKVASGVYCFHGLSFAAKSALVSADNSFGNDDTLVSVATDPGGSLKQCASADVTRIRTLDLNGTANDTTTVHAPALVDHGFYIWFED